jgi:hypothetical protein
MKPATNGMMETPIYGVAEAAQYLRVPQNTLAYWLKGGRRCPSTDQAGQHGTASAVVH